MDGRGGVSAIWLISHTGKWCLHQEEQIQAYLFTVVMG